MALIICPECRKQISDKSEICIHCGFPIEKSEVNISTLEQSAITPPPRHTHKKKGKFAKQQKKNPFYLRWWFIIPAIIALLAICIFLVSMGGNTQEKQVKQILEDDLDVSVTIAALYFNEEKQGYFVEFEAGNTADAAAIHLDTGEIEYKSEFDFYSKKAESLRKENPINESELHKYNQLVINHSAYVDWSFAVSAMKRNGESESYGWKEINLDGWNVDFRKQTATEKSRSFGENESTDVTLGKIREILDCDSSEDVQKLYPDSTVDGNHLIISGYFLNIEGEYTVCFYKEGSMWQVIFKWDFDNKDIDEEKAIATLNNYLGEYDDYRNEFDCYEWYCTQKEEMNINFYMDDGIWFD